MEEKLTVEERRDHALIEILMRLSALERILVEKGIINQEELLKYIKDSVNLLIQHMESDQKEVFNKIVGKLDNSSGPKN